MASMRLISLVLGSKEKATIMKGRKRR